MDLNSTISTLQAEADELQRQKQRHASELAAIQTEIVSEKSAERKARDAAAELDQLKAKASRAFTTKAKKLVAEAKQHQRKARELQGKYDMLQGEYAEQDAREPRTLEDLVGELVETKIKELK